MKQKTAALLAALLLVASCSFTALAGGKIDANPIPMENMLQETVHPLSLHAEPCPRCSDGNIRFNKLVENKDWEWLTEVHCNHTGGTGYLHDIFRATVDAYYKCDTCSYTEVVQEYDYHYYTYCYLYETKLDGWIG